MIVLVVSHDVHINYGTKLQHGEISEKTENAFHIRIVYFMVMY
jgi:hypothetical protein